MIPITNFSQKLWLVLAALVILGAPARSQYVFTTIDDPIAKTNNNPTMVNGISGNTVVGAYNGPQLHGFYHVLGTTNYTTIDEPLGYVNGSSSTVPSGISGNIIVGNYQNYQGSSAGYYGFLYNITNGVYMTLNDPDGDYQNASNTWPTAIDGTNILGYLSDNVSIYFGFTGGFEAQYTGASFVYGTPFYYPAISHIYINAGYNTTNDATYITGVSGSNAVGYYVDMNNVYHGVIYNLITGNFTPLSSPSGGGCPLTGIDGKNVVGYYADPTHGYNYSGFIYNLVSSNYTATAIHDPLAPGSCYLLGISGNSLVGYFLDGNSYTHGFVATIPIPNIFLATMGTNLVFSVTNGIPSGKCHLITSTNLTLPISQWSVLSTNTFSTNGVVSITNLFNVTVPAAFFGVSE